MMRVLPTAIGLLLWAIAVDILPSPARAEGMQFELRGQVSGWLAESKCKESRDHSAGLRYIPELRLSASLSPEQFVDLEMSLNGLTANSSAEKSEEIDLELYRLKLRFAAEQLEARVGLQKLNFGPASLLRPLMWFDRLDPRDPLGLTDGVWALRFRYDTLNNTSLWLWGLYGNDRTKGYETLVTADGKPEFGGRLQFSTSTGELGLTGHTRKVNIPYPGLDDFRENRLAFDGRWDMEIGLWLEAVFQQQRFNALRYECTKMATVGTDYTLGIGNGLYVLLEHMATILSDDPVDWEDDYQISAYSLNYPVGYLDNVSAIGFCLWDEGEYAQHLAWQRTWDNWILNLSFFYYPDSVDYEWIAQADLPVTGYGGQVLVVYNH